MVVDDDLQFLKAVERRASRVAGLAVSLLASGQAALDHMAQRAPIELIVLDVVMPGIDGIETCRRLRRMAPTIPIILASGNMTPELVRAAREAGARDAFDKPYDFSLIFGTSVDAARDERIAAHLDLAANIARAMARRYGSLVAPDDILALARLGLCEAAARYDATRVEPFIAFAERRIRGAIQDELRRLSPRTRRGGEMLRKINEARRALAVPGSPEPSDVDVAGALALTVDELAVARAPNRVVYAPLDDDAPHATSDPSPADAAERTELLTALDRARHTLDEPTVRVMEMLYERAMSTAAVARELQVPSARVTQIHARALGTLRRLLAA